MFEADWDATDFVAQLDAGEFDGRVSETLLELSPAQLREVESILLYRPVPVQRSTGLEYLKPTGSVN